MNMKLSFRWYGEDDPVTLENISQIPGMRSIVSAVYDVKPGEVWGEESLSKMKKQCEEHGLVFDVVESIPVHEDIKLGRNDVDELLETLSYYAGETEVIFVQNGKKMRCTQKVAPNKALMAELVTFLPENCIKLL